MAGVKSPTQQTPPPWTRQVGIGARTLGFSAFMTTSTARSGGNCQEKGPGGRRAGEGNRCVISGFGNQCAVFKLQWNPETVTVREGWIHRWRRMIRNWYQSCMIFFLEMGGESLMLSASFVFCVESSPRCRPGTFLSICQCGSTAFAKPLPAVGNNPALTIKPSQTHEKIHH